MSHPQLDRFSLRMEPLASRPSKFEIESRAIPPDQEPGALAAEVRRGIAEAASRIRRARARGRPVLCAFGAHAIKNGLGPVLIRLIEERWLTHLATNGAGIIHDWEFAFAGKSCEHVEPMVEAGRFGNWEETGRFLNLALNVGAYEGRGYGESIGALIEREGLSVPSERELEDVVRSRLGDDPLKAAAAADLLWAVREFRLEPGWMAVPHPWKRFSAQAAALRLGVPLTGHPMIGHDIIYNHPMNHCASLGRAAERDFLIFAEGVSRISGGVYISLGSAIMSPMIFEKSMSMAQNLARQRGERVEDHTIVVVDLAASSWDWSRGEPPEDDPAYYLRYNKTFSRMGGELRFLRADNRDFLLALARALGRGGGS
ncbi:MAG: hypothetical protein JXA90_12850 [Planctomycetes bacterium]|nr:hypothetical protein [Planctomycetota bacterium]